MKENKKILTITGKFDIFSYKTGKKIGSFGYPNETHTYLINGYLKNANIINKPVEKLLIKVLPKPEKKLKNQKDLQFFLYINNDKRHKASTLAHLNKFYVNTNFLKNLNFYEKSFVIGHELGHRFYYNENFCDLFALHFLIINYIDPRFVDFDKILFSNDRKNFIKNSFKFVKI